MKHQILNLRKQVLELALDDEELVGIVSSWFAPSTPLESNDRFKKLFMPTSRMALVDSHLSFILDFETKELRCHTSLPPEKLFVEKLRPSRLSDRVRFRDPST